MIDLMKTLIEGSWYPEDFTDKLDYLEALKDLYFPCDQCGRMIAPDETFRIGKDMYYCMECEV